ncbi:MAG: hypothetical protein PHX27_02540 [Candidatus ainarchaeum sp.]|nr:hypothetical protein [Candidatus ainarchaeum sp.]
MIKNLLNPFILNFASDVDFTQPIIEEVTSFLPSNFMLILIGIGLIIATIIIIFFLKKIIINSVIGLVIWGIALFVFNIPLPLIPSLVVSIIIGPAGIGTMLLLNAFGLLVI